MGGGPARLPPPGALGGRGRVPRGLVRPARPGRRVRRPAGGEGTAPGLDAAADALRALAPALCARWEAHAAREALEASERRSALYGGICDALADPVLVTDARNRILLENGRARSLFHPNAGDGDERLHRVKVNNFLFTAFLARPRPSETEARELTLVDPGTGEELLFEAVPAPLPPGFAVPADATVSLLRDVTELRRAGNQLGHQVRRVQMAEVRARSERDQLNLILAHVGAPIIVTDPRGAVTMMNREAQRLFRPGGAPGEAPGAAVVANADRFFAALEAFSAAGQAEQVTRVALRDPESGAELPAELVTGVIRDGDGAMLAVVSILHDLTQEVENARLAAELARVNEGLEQSIREATAELQEQNRQLAWQGQELERAYRHKSEFLASMSHELRTPINALLGYTALLRERIYGDLTPRQDEALQRMQSSSSHLLELVNDILDLARIEAGRMPVHLEAVLLGPLVESVVDSVEPLARAKELALVVDVPADLPALITDRTRDQADRAEPAEQRGQVHPRRLGHAHGAAAAGGRRGGGVGGGYGDRHRAGGPGRHLRGLSPGGPVVHARVRRHGAGAVHRPQAAGAAGRVHPGGVAALGGLDLYRDAAVPQPRGGGGGGCHSPGHARPGRHRARWPRADAPARGAAAGRCEGRVFGGVAGRRGSGAPGRGRGCLVRRPCGWAGPARCARRC